MIIAHLITKILVGNKSHGHLIIIVLECVVSDCQQCYVLSCVIYDQIDLAPVYDDRGENFFSLPFFIRHWPQILYQVGYYSLEKEELKWNNNNCKAVRAPVYHKAVRGYRLFFSYCLFNFFSFFTNENWWNCSAPNACITVIFENENCPIP